MLLPGVLPDHDAGTDVHIQGTNHTILGDLHANIDKIQQIHRHAVLLLTYSTETKAETCDPDKLFIFRYKKKSDWHGFIFTDMKIYAHNCSRRI